MVTIQIKGEGVVTIEHLRVLWRSASARYKVAHPEVGIAYRQSHQEEARKRSHEYYMKNKESVLSRTSEWQKENRPLTQLYWHRHDNRKRENTPEDELLTKQEWEQILEQYHYSCAYCGAVGIPLTIDHVIPVSRGGKHSKDNVVPACEHCNKSKSAKTPTEWRQMRIA